MQPTITIEQANQQVEEYSKKAREALPAEARYSLFASEQRGDCNDPSDNGPKNRVLASRTYRVEGLAKDKIPTYFDALRTWWQNHNFRVLDNNPPNEYLWVENNTDSFRMALEANPQGGLFLTSTSPCVWPNGTPVPEAQGAAEPTTEPGVAQGDPRTSEPAAEAGPGQPRKARQRPRPAADDEEDFSQTDWTDDSAY
ncbi:MULTISPECIES: hypothetical protein [Amycolatopsis]|uniref:Uncharacterized protein n=1 Tax=Amycolatopsis albidoflavus TaxID=102226 RepID=A0ABW5I2J0_9PSEU